MATEVEIKWLLDAEGYARLRALLDTLAQPEVLAQRNHYLDLPDAALRRLGAMLRLRVVGNREVLTLKARAHVERGILRALELERELLTEDERAFWRQRPLDWRAAVERLGDWLETAGLTALAPLDVALDEVGFTDNVRCVYHLTSGLAGWSAPLTLELDRTQYPGAVERLELECEHADADRLAPALSAWLDAHGIGHVAATETKYAQFLRLAASA